MAREVVRAYSKGLRAKPPMGTKSIVPGRGLEAEHFFLILKMLLILEISSSFIRFALLS